MNGKPDRIMLGLGLEPDRENAQWMQVRCRKCETCIAHRRRHWTARAIAETRSSQRTWFGTLTLRPDRATWARYAAHAIAQQRGYAPTDVTEALLFKYSVEAITPELTRWLKRLRKASSASLRYLLVAEPHKSGTPHWHVLIHEHEGAATKRALDASWRFGFSQWRLVDVDNPRAAGYVCKYISKSLDVKIRASMRYGQAGPELATERLLGVTRQLTNAVRKVHGSTRPVSRGKEAESNGAMTEKGSPVSEQRDLRDLNIEPEGS